MALKKIGDTDVSQKVVDSMEVDNSMEVDVTKDQVKGDDRGDKDVNKKLAPSSSNNTVDQVKDVDVKNDGNGDDSMEVDDNVKTDKDGTTKDTSSKDTIPNASGVATSANTDESGTVANPNTDESGTVDNPKEDDSTTKKNIIQYWCLCW